MLRGFHLHVFIMSKIIERLMRIGNVIDGPLLLHFDERRAVKSRCDDAVN